MVDGLNLCIPCVPPLLLVQACALCAPVPPAPLFLSFPCASCSSVPLIPCTSFAPVPLCASALQLFTLLTSKGLTTGKEGKEDQVSKAALKERCGAAHGPARVRTHLHLLRCPRPLTCAHSLPVALHAHCIPVMYSSSICAATH